MSGFIGNNSFIGGGSGGGNSGGGTVNVIDNLVTSSSTDALSANQGKVVNDDLQAHKNLIASQNILGHVKVDGTSIVITADGTISATGGGVTPSGRFYEQAVLETTEIDQTTWKIPFADFNYPQDLLIVSQNSVFLNTNMFTVTQTGNDWFVNIPNDSGYPLPIANNAVFIIAIKGFGGGTTSIVQNSYEEKLVTDTIGQSKWEITSSNFDPVNDTIFPLYNTTVLHKEDYFFTEENGIHYINLVNVPNDLPIQYNSLSLKVLYNTVSDGMNAISGQLLIDNSVPEKKLMPNLRDKINTRTIVLGVRGSVANLMHEDVLRLPFDCEVVSVDITVITPSSTDATVNVRKTTDFTAWNDVFNNISLPANTNYIRHTPSSQVLIPEGEFIRLFTDAFNGASALSVNVVVKTI